MEDLLAKLRRFKVLVAKRGVVGLTSNEQDEIDDLY